MTASREIHLVRRPDGIPKPDDFAVVDTTLADPADGELLVQNLLMSVDPYMRPRFNADQALGEALIGSGIGRVVASRNSKFAEGDIVQDGQDGGLGLRGGHSSGHLVIIVVSTFRRHRPPAPTAGPTAGTDRRHRPPDRRWWCYHHGPSAG